MEELKRIARIVLQGTWGVLCAWVVILLMFAHEVWQAICRVVSALALGVAAIALPAIILLLIVVLIAIGLSFCAMWLAHKTYELIQNWQKRRKAERQILETHREEVDRAAAAEPA